MVSNVKSTNSGENMFRNMEKLSSRFISCFNVSKHCREITAPRRKDAADITGGVGGNSDAACCAKSCALFSCVGKSLVGKCWECWECWEMLGMLGIMTWKFKVFNPSMPFYAHMSKMSCLGCPVCSVYPVCPTSDFWLYGRVQLPPARFTLVDTWPACKIVEVRKG